MHLCGDRFAAFVPDTWPRFPAVPDWRDDGYDAGVRSCVIDRRDVPTGTVTEDVGGHLFQIFGQLGDSIEEAGPLLGAEEHATVVEDGRTLGLNEQVA